VKLTDLVRAVVLVIAFADFALEASRDLSSNSDTVTDFYCVDFVADLDGRSDDLMANAEW
jgi:hypothetical protein